MQTAKSIDNLSDIQEICHSNHRVIQNGAAILSQFRLHGIFRMLKSVKQQGISPKLLFFISFFMRFLDHKNVYSLCSKGIVDSDLDDNAVYRFLANERVPWRKILIAFTKQALNKIHQRSASYKDADRCLIIDDSVLHKTGKNIEKIGKVFDHSSHKYVLGFKLLLCCLWDGCSTIPLDFTIHSEARKNGLRGLTKRDLASQFSKKRRADSYGQLRMDEVFTSKLEMAKKMIQRAISNKIDFKYILVDSWFVNAPLLSFVHQLNKRYQNKYLLGLMKSNYKFAFDNKSLTAKQLAKKKHFSRSRKFKVSYNSFLVQYHGVKLRIFIVRTNSKSKAKTLVTTDLNLTFTKAMELYSKRWSIEVLFKDCKQYLGLEKTQSQDFDAIIANTSIILMNYTTLALYQRINNYESIGALFNMSKEFYLKKNIGQSLLDLIHVLLNEIAHVFNLCFDELLDAISSSEQVIFNFYRIFATNSKSYRLNDINFV